MKLNSEGGDLSRRQRCYELKGLSFREYLDFEGLGSFPARSLEEMLANHRSIARGMASKFPVVAKFKRYLANGCYPFYKTARGGYLDRIAQVVTQTQERDWPETMAATRRSYFIRSSCAVGHPQ